MYIGTANINCEMTSGGVKIAPKTKQIIKNIPLKSFNLLLSTILRLTMAFTKIGIWKAKPKAKIRVKTKFKNFDISVVIFIDSGPTDWKKLNTLGSTKKLQKNSPKKNSRVPSIVREKTIPFSFLYRPGAMNANAWYKKKGIETNRAKNPANLKGTIKGDATSIAISSISEIPLSNVTRKSNMELLNGYMHAKAMIKNIKQ